MTVDEFMGHLSELMHVKVQAQTLFHRMIVLDEIIELTSVDETPDMDASLEYMLTETAYTKAEWAASCIEDDLYE